MRTVAARGFVFCANLAIAALFAAMFAAPGRAADNYPDQDRKSVV
jgi:hypothetical protein